MRIFGRYKSGDFMHRYFIQLAYNGSNYHGWQIQPNANSVQSELEKALSILLRESVSVIGAGRTDTGVHASFFVAHFEVSNPIFDNKQLKYKLNRFLPGDIRIDTIFKVDSNMHARFSATSRTYRYFLTSSKEPFRNNTTAFMPYELDLTLMSKAVEILYSTSDFTSFSKLHTDVKTNICKISKAEWTTHNGLMVFEISADRFLRNMVRAIVGTLIDLGREKISIEDFQQIIDNKDRRLAGASAEAKALFLVDITYPEPINDLFLRTNYIF